MRKKNYACVSIKYGGEKTRKEIEEIASIEKKTFACFFNALVQLKQTDTRYKMMTLVVSDEIISRSMMTSSDNKRKKE